MRRLPVRSPTPLAALVAAILLATLSIDFLSAWIRHTEAGLGCRDWPSCYARIGATMAEAAQPGPARQALAPDPLTKRAHRLIATALVVMVLMLLYRSRQRRELAGSAAQLPLLMAALLLLLAVIGPASYLKTRPAIAACNLLGGVALAALGWRLLLDLRAAPCLAVGARTRRTTRLALALLALQIALGAWVSANFAGLGCSGLFGCALPPVDAAGELPAAFWYFRELGLDADGRVQMTPGTVAIHIAHRAGACLSALALAGAGTLALRDGVPRHFVWPVFALLALQLALGALSVTASLPLSAVLAHSSVATLLLLALLRLDHAFAPAAAGIPRT
jgi:heme a synthase